MDIKGKEQNRHLAQSRLKKCIRDVKSTLTSYQLHTDEIEKYLEPIEELLKNIELWRNPSEGLAIFLNRKEGLRYYKVPIHLEIHTYVAGYFYLLPLLPLYHNDGVYYLLELSQDYIKLYEASRYHFKDVYVEDVAPSRLEEAVGSDFEQKNLQFRSGHATHGASFHGQGAGKDDEKKELLRFYRMIDEGVRKKITDLEAPLVLSCSDGSYAMYREANTYHNLYEKYISGDPQFKEDTERHQESWDLVEPYFKQRQTQKLETFTEHYHTQRTSYEIKDIVSAALDGKIDTLFIQKNGDLFGTYNKETDTVTIDANKEITNTSLANLTALQTFKQGGDVYFLPQTEMPVKESTLTALFRY